MPKVSHTKEIIYTFLEDHVGELETMEKGHIEKLYGLCFPDGYVVGLKTFTSYVQKFKKEKGIKRKYKDYLYYVPKEILKNPLVQNILKDIANSD
jgi:hypothetical protein